METNEPILKEEKPKRDKLFLYLFLLMTGLCLVLSGLFWTQKAETETVITENIQITQESEVVKRDLQNLQTDYAMLETNDVFLKAEIEEKKKLIEQLQRDAEKHKDDTYIIARLKKETKTLRDIMQHFVVEIDSLNTINKKLVAERDSVSTELGSEKEKRNALQTEKDKLFQLGSVIKSSGMKVTALNVKSKTKATETTKAKRTDKIMVAFKLEENNIAPKGPRTIYVRIVMPDGKEWCDSPDADHLFTFGSSRGYYAMKKALQYNNEDISVEMLVRKKETQELPSGKYHVEVCLDNSPIGKATLELD
ncbi:MAG: hypothetical protein EPN85_05355 [Bacteroidetes bacterium]|nr:MAG: hypothetical protein EPN85_05355 [Bacteroidota bacterium]